MISGRMTTCAGIASIVLLSSCMGSTATAPTSLASAGPAKTGSARTIQGFLHARASTVRPPAGDDVHQSIDSSALSGADDDRQLLYVSDIPSDAGAHGFVTIYADSARTTLRVVGTISGLDSPTEIAVDRDANVYVVQTDTGAPVLVFKRDGIRPFRTLDTQGALPVSIAVGKDGSVYVGSEPGAILVYARGKNTPTSTLSIGGDGPNDLFLDRDGNLYYEAVVFGDIGGIIGMFPRGSTTASVQFDFPDSPLRAQLLYDGDMAIEPLSVDRIDRFGRDNATTLRSSFAIPFTQAFCLNRAQSKLYAGGAGTITTFAFPAGTSLNSTSIGGPNDANFGCASSPVKRLPRPF